ncbi:NuA4-domain-containing protein [Lophiostoma macrostomum CBS 122681]|uniref:Chromatin modification-related protein EAF6 n=1 Tax=Lophiostoma macrostomum CBS 122681 TaxID=1314788 RepID=A0A6A6TVQ9_9PLEO|nr:NuA4-domain-containing protein [Lophiostoma macrostomum CBS 122681]
MAENAPPPTAVNGTSDAARGVPYYERLKRDLRESLQKKRQIDNNLAQIEENITRAETSYLEETSAGNIIKGFDNYIKGAATTTTTGGAGTATRRKATISDIDRIFSRSSSSFLREASTPGGSTQTTPSHAPTPSSSFLQRETSQPTPNGATKNGTATKKKRTPDEEDAVPVKRGKITYSRDER